MSVTLIIIIITCLISFYGFSNQKLVDDLIFYPPAISRNKQWYRFFSCGLIHADMGHLFFNMFALYLFGDGQNKSGVEHSFVMIFGDKGKILYLALYILALAFCLLPTYSKNKNNPEYRSLGASGAVSAVIFVQILLSPMMGIGIIFVPVFIAGFVFGALYLAVSSWLDKRGGGNVNHSAHIFGALFGVVFMIIACKLFSDFPVLQNFIDQVK
ncbi:MAG: rhomboid family intramembrane serine protease, partial [Chitinophagaceae bacterium]|nr:rhomboid family intramembrane serine protease [Chitinophagaceae bacterium]